jgi:NADP-dependent 3-hydroxy acid dehydrogenase YdfG
VGTVEELSANHRTLMLVRDQFEKNFFGPMNIIKAAIPQMRSQMNGHIIAQTATTGKYTLFYHMTSLTIPQATLALQV